MKSKKMGTPFAHPRASLPAFPAPVGHTLNRENGLGVGQVKDEVRRRVLAEAAYVLKTGATVRACATRFGAGKTTVHKDLRQRLPMLNPALSRRVAAVLERNRRERHLRGGEATRRKYREGSGKQEPGIRN